MPKKPPRPRTGRAHDRSTVAFWVFLVVALIACAAMYQAVSTRGPSDVGYHSSYVPAQATPTPAPTPAPAPALVAVVGDAYPASAMGGNGDANWTKVAAATLSVAGKPVQLAASGPRSLGYIKPLGADGTALPQQVDQTVKPEDRVVLVFASSVDAEQSQSAVRSAARAAYTQIKVAAPGAALIVVGPSSTSDRPSANLKALRDTLRTEATTAGATFVDPLADGWFTGDNAKLMGPDGARPTDAGNVYLAGLIELRIVAALG